MVAPFHLGALEEAANGANGAKVADRVPPVPPVSPAPTAPPARHTRRRRTRRRLALILSLVAVLALVLVLAAVAVVRLQAPTPVAVVTDMVASTVRAASSPVVLPWPTTGQAAVAVPSVGIDVTSGTETPVPIASLTKIMTAYVILHDHPLGPTQNGPSITMGQADVDDFNNDTVEDEANAQVTMGEVLTERQMLEGLLVHSANNFADTLARWDAGSIPAFVAKMNSTAAQLGMDHTHYADPSGFDEGSQSTAGDLLKVAGLDMENPTFAGIVRMSSVTLPVAGTISTYTPWLGFQGVIGVKSGFTTAAGGCDIVAVMRTVQGQPTLVLSAVTGQTGPNVLLAAGYMALNLVDHATTFIQATPLVRAGQVVAHVSVAGHTVAATAARTGDVLSWPGVRADQVLVDGNAIVAGAKKGRRVGSVVIALGTQRVVVPVALRGDLPKPTLLQRLF
jgi:serine-type D-Ala-D-Ala carboxypeptidase (penicillin-binding protein 5/6)